MRKHEGFCDWCMEGGPNKSLHMVTAKEACPGTSDREAFRMELCESCGTALKQGEAQTLFARRHREKEPATDG